MKSEDKIYQFKITLKGISPKIWRRVLIQNDGTLADLHNIIQIVMGWTDCYLNEFIINKQYYSIPNMLGNTSGSSYTGKNIKICDLKLEVNKKFLYKYDFMARWNFDITLEKILPIDEDKTYPVCISGKGASPDEECGGVNCFQKQKDDWKYDKYELLYELSTIFADKKNSSKRICDVVDIERIEQAQYWINIDKYEYKDINKHINLYTKNGRNWRKTLTEIDS